MIGFRKMFGRAQSVVIGMIHVKALPGTPRNVLTLSQIIQDSCEQAEIYKRHGVDAVLIENMHDVPYLKSDAIGCEITSAMTRICTEVKRTTDSMPLGVQILAGGNKQALAACAAAGGDFIRAEGFVFAHVADEGILSACAGELLRFRKTIGAENVKIFTDIKKKHGSHAITADVNLQTTAKTAEFFLSDGIILTGQLTGDPVNMTDFQDTQKATALPLLIGSGITHCNVDQYMHANGMIVGSCFKFENIWKNELVDESVLKFMNKVTRLREMYNLK